MLGLHLYWDQTWTDLNCFHKNGGCNRKPEQPWRCFLIGSRDPKFEETQLCFNSAIIQCLWMWEQHSQHVASSRTRPVLVTAAKANQPTELKAGGWEGLGLHWASSAPLLSLPALLVPFSLGREKPCLCFLPELALVLLFPISLSDPKSPLTSLLEQKL